MVDAVQPAAMTADQLARARRKLATIHDLEGLRGFREGLSVQELLSDPNRGEIQARMTALYAAKTGKGARHG